MSPRRTVLRVLYRGAGLLAIVGMLGWGSIVDSFSGRKEACEILSIGKPATGRVVRLIDTGTTINDDPVVEFVLEVTPPDGPSRLAAPGPDEVVFTPNAGHLLQGAWFL
jgi:hypothetical protein